MLGLFKRKSEKDKLKKEYDRLMALSHKLSKTDRKASDALFKQAEDVMDQMLKLNP